MERALGRLVLWLGLVLALASCGAESVVASKEFVDRARYVHSGPPSITLYTVVSNTNNSGAHSALLINGSQRLIFDPAGTWHHPNLPERNDVHYGMTPRMVDFYVDYHARETFRVYEQTVMVSPAVAELAIQRAEAYGAVAKAQCTRSVTDILRGLPGFESVKYLMTSSGTERIRKGVAADAWRIDGAGTGLGMPKASMLPSTNDVAA